MKNPWLPEIWVVERRIQESEDTVSLELRPESKAVRPEAEPGQFNMLYSPGYGEIPVSISSMRSGSFLHTIRSVGAISAALAGAQAGSCVGVRGPFGSSWPLSTAFGKNLLLLAGGLGLAPLRPVIEWVRDRREDFADCSVLHGARDRDHLIFRDELVTWQKSPGIHWALTLDHADLDWEGHVGSLPQLLDLVTLDKQTTVALLCGPEIMMRAAAAYLVQLGLPAERIYLSLERNMKCALGFCGHCQLGPEFICRDGPILAYDRVAACLGVKEL
ncbi:MAG TPA: FAD/NAD(P)-binding protein [Oligoflexus sp.]|uniref:FAD/NAD(P)-binding protein n=1 Tax=Oligoflexus sp. TaxID=1971216 RepID=UPI002D809EE2|nr:FAD/NAD(P)-binding protein [Oligoflexus sp.]HET9240116.1 FAD/NAD(P)-binding protein [Oligoflexus sp.]